MNCYHHFTIEERTCLRKYYMEGLSFRKIAKLLGRSPSSISREIARNYTSRYEYNTYYPHTAHKSIYLDVVFVIVVCLATNKSLNI